MANEALMIADVSFVVTSQIDRAPQWTMVREQGCSVLDTLIAGRRFPRA
jgi:hypothetical protein